MSFVTCPMNFYKKTNQDIKLSLPYFNLLSNHTLSLRLRRVLIEEAPEEFYNILTQLVRHYLNGSFSHKNKKFLIRFKKPLLLLSDPSTNVHDKKLIIEFESFSFMKELYESLNKGLKI